MRPLRPSPAIARLPIVRVLERLATVLLFGVLVYMLALLISMLEVMHRPPARIHDQPRRPLDAAALGNPAGVGREFRRSLPVMEGAPCVLVVHGDDGGLLASQMFCNGRPCVETQLKINRRGQVVCTPERVRP